MVSNKVDGSFGGSKASILIRPVSFPQKGVPRYSEESVLQLERELVQARLKEAESQCALKEMQDKILDMEKVGVCVSPSSPTQRRRLLWNPPV